MAETKRIPFPRSAYILGPEDFFCGLLQRPKEDEDGPPGTRCLLGWNALTFAKYFDKNNRTTAGDVGYHVIKHVIRASYPKDANAFPNSDDPEPALFNDGGINTDALYRRYFGKKVSKAYTPKEAKEAAEAWKRRAPKVAKVWNRAMAVLGYTEGNPESHWRHISRLRRETETNFGIQLAA